MKHSNVKLTIRRRVDGMTHATVCIHVALPDNDATPKGLLGRANEELSAAMASDATPADLSADAAMTAAAPELYFALKVIMQEFGYLMKADFLEFEGEYPEVEAAYAALKSAKGQGQPIYLEMAKHLEHFASFGTLTFDGQAWQCRCGGRGWREGEPMPENNFGCLFLHKPDCRVLAVRELLSRLIGDD